MSKLIFSRKQFSSFIFQCFCMLTAILILLPVLYALSISFMESHEILHRDLRLLPGGLYTGNYVKAFTQTTLLRFMWNSLVVATVVSVVRIFAGSLAAFSFAFFQFPGKRLIFYLYLCSLMIPIDILLLPNYLTVSRLGLINTYLGMMIVFFTSALFIFMMRQAFLSYSKSLKEAAHIDGCSNFKFYWNILLPSSVPIGITIFISSFVSIWNTYIWPMLVTTRNEMRTIQVAITMLNFPDESPHGSVMAAAVLILLPSIFIFMVGQRWIKAGMSAGAIKG